MSKSKMFNAAHKEAAFTLRRYPYLTYRQAFSNALRGYWAVAGGFTGEL